MSGAQAFQRPATKTQTASRLVLTVLPCQITLGAFSEAYLESSLIQSGLFTGTLKLKTGTFGTGP
jgi:hypothetical protein